MNKRIVIALMLFLPVAGQAQFGKLANKVKSKINQRADAKADKAIDKTLDAVEGKNSPATPAATAPADTEAVGTKATPPAQRAAYTRYDFIPGEKVLYAEDFATEAAGELPTGWNTNGSGEVVTLDGLPGNWLRLHKSFSYLSSNTKLFGTDYTIEFDLVMDLKNNGWMFPSLVFGVLAADTLSTTDNELLNNSIKFAAVTGTLYPGTTSSRASMEASLNGRNYYTGSVKDYNDLEKYYGQPVHIAMQFQKERCRIWINEVKAFDAPKAVPIAKKMNQLVFKLSHTNYAEEQYGIYISNIKVATGLPDTRHKLAETGTFSTTGILFDVNAATLRPESYGVIREIAAVLKENPGMQLLITGHTSSDGDEKVNLDLSRRRAAAVKQALVDEFQVDAGLLETDGKGESMPVADNATREGKAANRRVEFKRR